MDLLELMMEVLFVYVVLFGPEKYDAICNRIKYLIGPKSGITYILLTILQKSKLILIILCP